MASASPSGTSSTSRPTNSSLDSLLSFMLTYRSLNPPFVPTLSESPTSLRFLRDFVSLNRPVLLKSQGQRERVPALAKWDEEYLIEVMQGQEVDVAVSPDGKADSIVCSQEDRKEYFVEPATIPMTLSTLFSHLHSERSTEKSTQPVYYLQSQNGNLQADGELAPLLADVDAEGPAFAREAFGSLPDAVNIWIGDHRSVTSLHKDPYENIYLVVRGSKTFTLLPPTEHVCLEEKLYPHATYTHTPPSTFTLTPTDPPVSIPWISIDPSSPPPSSLFSSHARPLRITLDPGDMLYLPSLWYHQVEQSGDPLVIAVNWWYDMRMEGPAWSVNEFIKDVSNRAREEAETGRSLTSEVVAT